MDPLAVAMADSRDIFRDAVAADRIGRDNDNREQGKMARRRCRYNSVAPRSGHGVPAA